MAQARTATLPAAPRVRIVVGGDAAAAAGLAATAIAALEVRGITATEMIPRASGRSAARSAEPDAGTRGGEPDAGDATSRLASDRRTVRAEPDPISPAEHRNVRSAGPDPGSPTDASARIASERRTARGPEPDPVSPAGASARLANERTARGAEPDPVSNERGNVRSAEPDPADATTRPALAAAPPLEAYAELDERTRDGLDRIEVGGDVVAWALAAIPTPAATLELAEICARTARSGRPVCLLAPAPQGTGRVAIERAAALAYLRAHGAAIAHDVDAWLEAIVLLVRFGLPVGPRAAVIAPPGSWLEAQARALGEVAGNDRLLLAAPDDPTDVVLFAPELGQPSRMLPETLYVPVAARGELAGNACVLYGVRSALAAIELLGRAAERIAVGLGPAPREAAAELAIDQEFLARQLARLDADQPRIGDHETKTLLRAYGVPITRQVVARTPSAAVRRAREDLGYPVELKPWGHDLPTEPAGCPVERDLTSDALVRQAYSAVLSAAGGSALARGDVIVREQPPAGRNVTVTLLELPSLGWTVVLDAPGAPRIAAAPAPLRLIDAQTLAMHVVASRAGDPEPDHVGLANLLRRASHLVVDVDRIAALDLPRVVVGGRGARTLVVDAAADLITD